jgi:hypothetical protein
MQNKGLILIGLNSSIKPNSFCPLCEESYMDFTDLPSDFPDAQNIQEIAFPE